MKQRRSLRIDPPADRSPSIRPEIPGRWAPNERCRWTGVPAKAGLFYGFEEKIRWFDGYIMGGWFENTPHLIYPHYIYIYIYTQLYGFFLRWFRVIWWDAPIIFAGLLAALPAHLRLGEPVYPQSPDGREIETARPPGYVFGRGKHLQIWSCSIILSMFDGGRIAVSP